MSGYHVIVEGKTGSDDTVAGQAMQALTETYPGHPWHVEVKDGVLILKHMRISNKWAQIKHLKNIYSASDLKKAMVLLGGEFLERAGLVRGAATDDRIRLVDGIPQKDVVIA
jgi:hypothetical protein